MTKKWNVYDIQGKHLGVVSGDTECDALDAGMKQHATLVYVEKTTRQDDKLQQIYSERNACIIAAVKLALKAGLPAGRGTDPNAMSSEWAHVVYISLPGGQQVSYHISPDQVHLLEGLPTYPHEWDGTYLGRDADWCKYL